MNKATRKPFLQPELHFQSLPTQPCSFVPSAHSRGLLSLLPFPPFSSSLQFFICCISPSPSLSVGSRSLKIISREPWAGPRGVSSFPAGRPQSEPGCPPLGKGQPDPSNPAPGEICGDRAALRKQLFFGALTNLCI